ncbi:MAG: DUF4167 domain-containing protein [Rhodospirillaceae bacterium]
MRSGPKNRRSRGRGNGVRWGNTPRNHNFESSGPDGKVRGTAQQVVEKYQALAREASTAGDPIKAESYFQYAEHYLRVLAEQAANSPAESPREDQPQQSDIAGDDGSVSVGTPDAELNGVTATSAEANGSGDVLIHDNEQKELDGTRPSRRVRARRRPRLVSASEEIQSGATESDTDTSAKADASFEPQNAI